MKRSVSILLVAILVLNVLGYYGVFVGILYQNDRAMTKALDADLYNSSQAVTIKVPVTVAYMPDQAEFQRVDGKFEHQGKLYRMVKQRYAQDTLTVICVEDKERQKINQELAGYVKTFTDNAGNHPSNSKLNINFLKDYLPTTFAVHSVSTGWSANVIFNSHQGTLVPSFTSSIVHPPEKA